jgi:peptidoglycan/LPS O-acetylase OafA/YrhL
MEKRMREFDIIRAVAALSVIAIHLTASYVKDLALAQYWNELMRYAVPLFVILSGLVLYHVDLGGRKQLNYLAFQRKRLTKVLVPYAAWTALYIYYTARQVWREMGWDGAWRIADTLPEHLRYGTGHYHLYFLIITMELYVLYPLLRAWMKRQPLSLLLASFAWTAYSQTMIYLHHKTWKIYHFPHWIFYFVLGMYVAQHRKTIQKWLRGKEVWTGLLWLASFALLYWDGTQSNTHYSSAKPTVMLYAVTSFFFFWSVAARVAGIKGGIGKGLDWLSTHSFLIFLLHPLVLNLLSEQTEKYGYPHIWDGLAGMAGLYVCTVVLTCLGVAVISRIPLTQWIGATRIKKKPKLTLVEQKTNLPQ